MVDNDKVESFRLSPVYGEWLNSQSELTGRPKVYFVEQALALLISGSKVARTKLFLSLLLYIYAGLFFIVFSVYLIPYLPGYLVYMFGSLGAITLLIGLMGLKKIWRGVLKNGKN